LECKFSVEEEETTEEETISHLAIPKVKSSKSLGSTLQGNGKIVDDIWSLYRGDGKNEVMHLEYCVKIILWDDG